METGVLNEAYERLHHAGPEWGENTLTNHGPMAVETLVRQGHADRVHRWLDHYLRRLDDLPAPTGRVTDANWREALGEGSRVGDWTAYFAGQVAERPWREVLVTWWPRLLPGIVAGATHGVIRTGHAVRALLDGAGASGASAIEHGPAHTELAHALAFWAARWRPVPGTAAPAGDLDPAAALAAVPRIAEQNGTVAARLGQLPDLAGWTGALAGLRAPRTPDDVPAALRRLTAAGVLRYLVHGQASPVLLVHVATAPNAVLRTLPALPRELWADSLAAVWAASAALVSAYSPTDQQAPAPIAAPDADPAAVFERAVRHRDEHVIKFTDTALDVYGWTADPDALAAAGHVVSLIDQP